MSNNPQPRASKGSSDGGRFIPKARPEETTASDLSLSESNGTARAASDTRQDILQATQRLLQNKQQLRTAWDGAQALSHKANQTAWWRKRRAKATARTAWHRVGELSGERRVMSAICDNAWESHHEAISAAAI